MSQLRGVFTVVATPFKEDGAIDFDGFGNNLDFFVEKGGYGVCVAGTLGEYSAMTPEERKQVFEFAAKRLDGRAPLMAGTIATTTKQVIELTKHVGDNGGEGVLLLSHPGLGLRPEELSTYYREVADATAVDIMLYNNPGSNGIDMQFDLVKELSEHPRIVAIKESSNDVKRITRIADELKGSLTPSAATKTCTSRRSVPELKGGYAWAATSHLNSFVTCWSLSRRAISTRHGSCPALTVLWRVISKARQNSFRPPNTSWTPSV